MVVPKVVPMGHLMAAHLVDQMASTMVDPKAVLMAYYSVVHSAPHSVVHSVVHSVGKKEHYLVVQMVVARALQ